MPRFNELAKLIEANPTSVKLREWQKLAEESPMLRSVRQLETAESESPRSEIVPSVQSVSEPKDVPTAAEVSEPKDVESRKEERHRLLQECKKKVEAEGTDSYSRDDRQQGVSLLEEPRTVPTVVGKPLASQVLDQWLSTAKSCDVAGHSSLYDDTVATFYTKGNLTKTDVDNEIRNMCKTYSDFPALNLSAISWLPLSPGLVQVQFDKEFRATKAGGGAYEGKVHSEITLRQTVAEWRFVGERDTRVYWTRQTP